MQAQLARAQAQIAQLQEVVTEGQNDLSEAKRKGKAQIAQLQEVITEDHNDLSEEKLKRKAAEAAASALQEKSLKQDQAAQMADKGEKGDPACLDLARTLEKEVIDAVRQAQEALDNLDDGSKCPEEGQAIVAKATAAKDGADKVAKDATESCAAALKAPVDFGVYRLQQLAADSCNSMWHDPAYRGAKETVKAACDAKVMATAKAQDAQKTLKAAVAAASTAVIACRCKVKVAADQAWVVANENKIDNENAWTKAKHKECAFVGTPIGECEIPPCPAVDDVTLPDEVQDAVCDEVEPGINPRWENLLDGARLCVA